ncbi:MAG: rieske ironsulfur family protein [Candidatus Eremiobacteraeota bacterium]|nr:rieske ironsulfur family protein [Candidatus Eremiobacteraeota bacterium]
MAHAEAYKDPGTPEEQSRRTFMANAVIALGGVIGISLAIPLVASLVPAPGTSNDPWSGLTQQEVDQLKKATANTPVKVTFNVHEINGYFGATDAEQFVWAVRATEDEIKKERPDLKDIPYQVVNMGFVVFSPLCPHLGCRYTWNSNSNKFLCPCHGSEYSALGVHEAGPALRGLDPLPLREYQGKVQVSWILYAANMPAHIVIQVG